MVAGGAAARGTDALGLEAAVGDDVEVGAVVGVDGGVVEVVGAAVDVGVAVGAVAPRCTVDGAHEAAASPHVAAAVATHRPIPAMARR